MSSKHIVQEDRYIERQVDGQTGEIVKYNEITRQRFASYPVNEEKFIKIYYNTYLASIGENHSALSTFMIAIGKRMSYSKEGQTVYLFIDEKKEIAEEIGVTLNRVEHMIKECCDLELLIRLRRGKYAVSPFIMAKGEWKEVKALQLNYDSELKNLKISAPDVNYIDTEVNQIEGEADE